MYIKSVTKLYIQVPLNFKIMEPHRKLKWLIFTTMVCFSFTEVFAQMQKKDWVGTYTMNHDGWEGTLVIVDSKRDCTHSPWCSLNISYTDTEGNRRKAAISRFSRDWQYIAFQIRFPQHIQPFEGYLFSHDKNFLAGTTVWNNKTFGFYAKKQPAQTFTRVNSHNLDVFKSAIEFKEMNTGIPTQNEVTKRRILDDGSVELTYGDGKIEVYSDGTIKVTLPDGTSMTYSMMQVMTLVPPIPNDPDVNEWFGVLNSNMDDIVSHLLNGDDTSINNYKNTLADYSAAERINNGMKIIGFLIE